MLSNLRPKTDPAVLAKLQAEEAAAKQAQQAQLAQQQASSATADGQTNTSASVSFPAVSQAPFAPPAEQAAQGGPVITPVNPEPNPANPAAAFWQSLTGQKPPDSGSPPVASYGGYGAAVPPPPPGASGALVPPPPAVSLSTQAQMAPYGAPGVDPYGNPYANPYAQPQQPAPAARPSLFGSGGKVSSSADDSSTPTKSKKAANFVPITPTGMEARSPYKQRDDLKVLLKGALAASPLQKLAVKDERLAQSLGKLDVGLPGDSTKGSFNVSQRQIDSVFKPVDVDKRAAGAVKKMESDLTQTYYRYLYAYNKFALAQQTVAARKQEMDFAGSASEQQRAAADLAQAQSEADAAKEDMRAAQSELAGTAGAPAARTIIGRVSGVSPSLESLGQAETASPAAVSQATAAKEKPASSGGGLMSMLGFGKSPPKDAGSGGGGDAAAVAKADAKKGKGKKGKGQAGDLAPATQLASAAGERSSEPEPAAQAASSDGIAFELKNVNITPRKSILKVSIRNNGSSSFSFNAEDFSISEGNHKLEESSVRADFDSTLVEPNAEVTGTITIFGRPWSDRLSVGLAEGGKNIQLRR